MNSLIVASASALLYFVAYNTYGRFLARRIFKINPNAKCPSKTRHDGVDFVAADKIVLFGHHFTSIAGTGPIVGPALAVIWGWVPALLWILKGLGSKIKAFVTGAANIISGFGLPAGVVLTLMGVFVASFAVTTLDTATRLQRYVISELASNFRLPFLWKKHPATLTAVSAALLLAFSSSGGKGAMTLWPLFGTVNQLLGGLALLVITVWLARKNIPTVFTAVPMGFMIVITAWAMKINLAEFYTEGKWVLFGVGVTISILQIWMIAEGLMALVFLKRKLHVARQ